MKPKARVFEMTSSKKQYKIMQRFVCVICCVQLAFIVFMSSCFYYPIASRCTKFVFQKHYELEVIYILFLPWPKEDFAS